VGTLDNAGERSGEGSAHSVGMNSAWLALASLLCACAGAPPGVAPVAASSRSITSDATPRSDQPESSSPSPNPNRELGAEAETRVVAQTEPEAVAETGPDTALPPPRPSRPVCNRAELNTLLSTLPKDLEEPSLGSLTLEDLPEADATSGAPQSDSFGFFGSRDFDGNGKPDRVLLYTSLDYWLWLPFVAKRDCDQFLGAVPGYRVMLKKSKHNGMRDLASLSYPIQGHIERFQFDGKAYQLR